MPIRLLHTVGFHAGEVSTLIQHFETRSMKMLPPRRSAVKMNQNCYQMEQNRGTSITIDRQISLAPSSLGLDSRQLCMCATSG
jgi:hypothetical protein